MTTSAKAFVHKAILQNFSTPAETLSHFLPNLSPHTLRLSPNVENPDTRKAVCRLLESGRRAFLDRERHYRIQSNGVTAPVSDE